MTPAPKRRWLDDQMRTDMQQFARSLDVVGGIGILLASAIVMAVLFGLRITSVSLWILTGSGMIVGGYFVWKSIRRTVDR